MRIESEEPSKFSGDDDVFRSFERAALSAFRFLLLDYGFEHLSTLAVAAECALKFQNRSTRIIITWEWPYYVVVEVGRVDIAPDGNTTVEQHDLEHLLTIRCPEKKVTQKKNPDDNELKRVLEAYAAGLRECAEDVLKGDFSIFPQLRVLSEESIRRKRALSSPKLPPTN